MDEKTPRQVHQERLDAVQKVLDYLLKIAEAARLTEGKHMTGKDDKVVVTCSMWPQGTRVQNQYFDSGIGLLVTSKHDTYAIEYDPTRKKVIDTTVFSGETKGAGRIHFTYPGLGNTIGEAAKLLTIVHNVHEWHLE